MKKLKLTTLLEELIAEAKRDKIKRLVSGGIIETQGKILLLKRTSKDFMPNLYELPSGNLKIGENIISGLVREIKEETGLEVTTVSDYMGHFDYKSAKSLMTRQFNFVVHVSHYNVHLSKEHIDFAWVSSDRLDQYNISAHTQSIIQKFFSSHSKIFR